MRERGEEAALIGRRRRTVRFKKPRASACGFLLEFKFFGFFVLEER